MNIVQVILEKQHFEAKMSDLPVKKEEEFYAPAEKMDFSKIKSETFIVAVSTGDRDSCKALFTTVHGPYSFFEMAENVGLMWRDQLLHGKAFILNKDPSTPVRWLDKNTTEYIEEHWEDIVAEMFFEDLLNQSGYTCQAGVLSEQAVATDNP
jgi:hypothetical protein